MSNHSPRPNVPYSLNTLLGASMGCMIAIVAGLLTEAWWLAPLGLGVAVALWLQWLRARRRR